MARRELEIESQPGEEQPVSKQAKAVEVGRREERCCAVYEEAVKTLPTGESVCADRNSTDVEGCNSVVEQACALSSVLSRREKKKRNLSGRQFAVFLAFFLFPKLKKELWVFF